MAASLLLLAAAWALAASAPAPLLLTGARILDPAGERLLEGRDVLIEDGRIAAVGAAGTLQAPAGTRRLDLSGLTLIPGLIELHSHLLLHPYDETP
ncbi:MAG TPA: amidohydrolase family protein, partial [Actinomycetota bacterium]|nr:amidohydrolase family protein [Actinomycetota bacterium]